MGNIANNKSIFSENNKELEEIEPQFSGRLLIYIIIALLVTTVLFSCVFSVDVLVTGQGKVKPIHEVQYVQAFESGVIESINIKNGIHVKSGDVLIRLNPDLTKIDFQKVEQDLINSQAELAVQIALVDKCDLNFPGKLSPEAIHSFKTAHESELSAFNYELMVFDNKIQSKFKQQEVIELKIRNIQDLIPIFKASYEGRKKLYKKRYLSLATFNRTKETMIEKIHELKHQEQNLQACKFDLQSLKRERDVYIQNFYAGKNKNIVKINQKINILMSERERLIRLSELLIIRSPCEGVIEDLKELAVGSVLSVGQKLFKIVPHQQSFEMMVNFENKDIGFLKVGQNAEIMFDAFPFGIYGGITGRVGTVSQDTSTIEGDTHNYVAKVVLDQNFIRINGKNIKLVSGMTGMVNSKTSRRTLISYIASPIIECLKKSFKEP